MITLPMGEVPKIPDNFKCPICGKRLTLEITEWTRDYDGWKASDCGLEISCESEPDITDKNYEAWLDSHFQMPYVYWLPVDNAVYAWLEDNYRFEERKP